MELTDTRYEVDNGLAWITIDRPDRLNAFRARTVDELIYSFTRAWADHGVGAKLLERGEGMREPVSVGHLVGIEKGDIAAVAGAQLNLLQSAKSFRARDEIGSQTAREEVTRRAG